MAATGPSSITAYDAPGHCSQCGRAVTGGLLVTSYGDYQAPRFCVWCVLMALDDHTGYHLMEQYLSFLVAKQYYQKARNRGWSGKLKHRRPQ